MIKTWVAGEQVDADDLNNNFAQTLQTQNYTAGETISAGQAVYLKASDGKVWKADADANESLNNFIGIALEAGNANDTIMVQTEGLVTGLSGLTAGTFYYVSSTAGGLSATVNGTRIGIAISTTSLLLMKNRTADKTPVVRTYLNSGSPHTWTKPAGLRYVVVEVQGAGGNGGDASASSNQSAVGDGGGGGGYSRKMIDAGSLGGTETVTVGDVGSSSSFGSHCSATSGANGTQQGAGADGGIGSGGDVNIKGQGGNGTAVNISGEQSDLSGQGGSSHLGGGGKPIFAPNNTGQNGNAGGQYGGGGSGAGANDGNSGTGGAGGPAIVIVTEYF